MQTKTRVVGSGFTTINFRGQIIAFLEGFRDSGQTPIAQPEPIMPLGSSHPVEFATPRAKNAGTITLTIRELWNGPVWSQLQGLANSDDIIDIFAAVANEPSAITCQMVIRAPNGQVRGKTYHGVIVSQIDDSETVAINTLTVAKTLVLMYTHSTPIRG